MTDEVYMRIALEEATLAAEEGEVPVGAVVACDDEVVARAHNRRETDADPAAHAEFLALEKAARVLERWRLSDCTVYVTLEPCLMCAGLMVNARIGACVYGASDPKGGALGTLYDVSADERLNHSFDVRRGVLEDECAQLLRNFFRSRRLLHELERASRSDEESAAINEKIRAIETGATIVEDAMAKREVSVSSLTPLTDEEAEALKYEHLMSKYMP